MVRKGIFGGAKKGEQGVGGGGIGGPMGRLGGTGGWPVEFTRGETETRGRGWDYGWRRG